MMDNHYLPRCGDVGFVGYEQGAGLVNDAISSMTTGLYEDPTTADHQFQVIKLGAIIEASGKKRRVVCRSIGDRLTDCRLDKSHFIIFRPPVNSAQMAVINKTARKFVGKRYGYLEIGLQAIDGLLRKIGLLREGLPLFTRLGGLVPGTVICSGVSNRCLYAGGVLPKRFVYLSPDGTYDEAVRRGWRVVSISENGASYWTGAQTQGDAE